MSESQRPHSVDQIMDSRVQLKVIGKPSLIVGAETIEIKPRAVFELLAVIMAAGSEGVSRKALADRLWGHLDQANSRMQLRIAVHKLRDELRTLGIFEQFELGEKTVRYTGELNIDYLTLLKEQPPLSLPQVEALLYPIADGWNAEHWLAERDAFGEFVAKRLDGAKHQAKSREALTDMLLRATGCFPTTLSLYLQLAKVLRVQGREAELVEMVIQFEDRWVDRFGSADIPNLMELAKAQDLDDVPPAAAHVSVPMAVMVDPSRMPAPVHSPIAPKLAVGLVPILALSLLWSIGANARRASEGPGSEPFSPPTPHLLDTHEATVAGDRYRVTTIRVPASTLSSYVLLKGGRMVLRETMGGAQAAVEVAADGTAKRLPIKDGWRSLCDKAAVAFESEKSFSVKTILLEKRIQGTDSLPRVEFEAVLPNGSVLFTRQSLTPQPDASMEYLLDKTGEHPLVAGLKDKGFVDVTWITADSLYLKYSKGPSDGWKFKTARYDLGHQSLNGLACPPVVGRLANGTLICRPEVVNPDGKSYQSAPTGKVLLVSGTGHQTPFTVSGRSNFDAVFPVGNLLALLVHHGTVNSGLLFADLTGKPVTLPVPPTATTVKTDPLSGSVLLNSPVGAHLASDYFLVQTEP